MQLAYYIECGVFVSIFVAAGGFTLRRRRRRRHERYEQRLREILYESRISSFSNLANELSLPLALISGPCQQILEHLSADPFVRRQAGFIQRSIQRLNDLIFMINAMKSMAPDSPEERVELLDVSYFTGNVARSFVEPAKKRAVAFCMAIQPDVLFPVSQNVLASILNLLLTNALKRSRQKDEIKLTLALADDRLHVEVFNTGLDLDAGQIGLIYDPSRRLDYLEDLNRHGMRLSDDLELAIGYELVKKMDGDFLVESRSGRTTFTVELPRPRMSLAGKTRPRAARKVVAPLVEPPVWFFGPDPAEALVGTPYNASLPTVLVLADDADMKAFLSDLFRDRYNVHMVRWSEAEEYLSKSRPQIILGVAPELDSERIETIGRIRRMKLQASLPVVLMSAAFCPNSRVQGVELGVDACLALPFDITSLYQVVERLLHRYEALKDYGQSVYSALDMAQGRILHREDKLFLDKVLALVDDNLLNPHFSTQLIADRLGMSLGNFYRRLGTVTDQTPAAIIRERRLCRAERLLVTTKLSIDEIIYKAGFANRSTFFRSFTQRYGMTPKVYRVRKFESAVGEMPSAEA